MALSLPVPESQIPIKYDDRTGWTQIDSTHGQPYTLQFYRENLALNAAGEAIGAAQRTDHFTITLEQLQALAAIHPELKKYFVIPGLLRDLCDALAVILRQQEADELAAARLAALENQV